VNLANRHQGAVRVSRDGLGQQPPVGGHGFPVVVCGKAKIQLARSVIRAISPAPAA
jgi:hypothetical protein